MCCKRRGIRYTGCRSTRRKSRRDSCPTTRATCAQGRMTPGGRGGRAPRRTQTSRCSGDSRCSAWCPSARGGAAVPTRPVVRVFAHGAELPLDLGRGGQRGGSVRGQEGFARRCRLAASAGRQQASRRGGRNVSAAVCGQAVGTWAVSAAGMVAGGWKSRLARRASRA